MESQSSDVTIKESATLGVTDTEASGYGYPWGNIGASVVVVFVIVLAFRTYIRTRKK